MSKLIKKNIFVIAVILLTIPSFYRMLKPGIYSTQDFHLFRLVEFDKCVQAWQVPCRWSPDAGLGYGEPLFNFYGQLPYAVGELFHLIGFSFIDSLKILFILSLVGSAIAMFYLTRKLWKNDFAALVSAILYVYAPYRAVDVWVRGALPEALSFVLSPLIILAIESKSFLGFSFLVAVLILTHNLSALMFLPVIVIWILYRRFWRAIPAGFVSLLLSAFYLLPVIFESKFINLGSTIQGYFDFRGHFVTLSQLLISRFWGYGASVFGPEDGLSLAIGYLQWILPMTILALCYFFRKKISSNIINLTSYFTILGWFFLFLTHNKSVFIWQLVPGMAYIQFPWRFLGIATFCFALACGAVATMIKKKWLFSGVLITAAILLNLSFFREDLWFKVGDSYFTTGVEWDRQRIASIGDFWPNFGHKIPDKPATGEFINYFPGWNLAPDENGLIPAKGAVFKDTPVRKIGNIISLLTFIGVIIWRKKIFPS